MSKLVILFAVFLATLQGSYQLSLRTSRLNDLEEAIEEFAEVVKDVSKIIEFVGHDLSSVTRDYEHKIDDTINEKSIISLIQKHQDAINKVESEISEDSKSCIDVAWRNTMVAIEELKRGVDSCVSSARVVGAELQSTLETIDGKALNILNELGDGFHTCLAVNSNEETAKCLKDIIDPIKEKLRVLDQQVKDTHELVQKKVADAIRNLNICLQNVEHDFSLKSESTLEALGNCVQNGSRFFSKAIPKGIMDIIRELKEKIEYIIHILSHLPTSIAEIPDKINEIISHINISILVSHLKDEINEIINDGGSNAESCRPMADEKTDALVEASEETINKCLKEAKRKVDEIQANIAALSDEAKQILADISSQTYNCFLENKQNPVEFYKCLESHVDEFQQRVADLQQKVADTYEHSKEQADEILQSLAQCVNKVQMDTIKQGQVIIKDVETCVRLSHPMLFM